MNHVCKKFVLNCRNNKVYVKIQAVINDVKESVTGISESVHEDVRISLNNTDAEVTTVKNSMNQVRDYVKVINRGFL